VEWEDSYTRQNNEVSRVETLTKSKDNIKYEHWTFEKSKDNSTSSVNTENSGSQKTIQHQVWTLNTGEVERQLNVKCEDWTLEKSKHNSTSSINVESTCGHPQLKAWITGMKGAQLGNAAPLSMQ